MIWRLPSVLISNVALQIANLIVPRWFEKVCQVRGAAQLGSVWATPLKRSRMDYSYLGRVLRYLSRTWEYAMAGSHTNLRKAQSDNWPKDMSLAPVAV